MAKTKTEEFIRESNAIEGVLDIQSLKDGKKAWKRLKTVTVLKKEYILEVHKLVMANQPITDSYKGNYRRCAVFIGGSEALVWPRVPMAVESWLANVNHYIKGNRDTLAGRERVAREHHVNFEVIHPFVDGNGRVGRILYNWERKRLGLDIDIIKVSERGNYYAWF